MGVYFFSAPKYGQEVDRLIGHKGKLIAAIEIKSSKKVSTEYLEKLPTWLKA
jgi:hypothetical protein